MNKKTIKKFVPATYEKIESANKKLSSDLEKKINNGLNKTIEKTVDSKLNSVEKVQKKTSEELTNLGREIFSKVKDIIWKLDNNFPVIRSRVENIPVIKTKLDHELPKIEESLSYIQDNIEKTRYFYKNDYERRVIKSFYEIYEQPDFKDKFLKLVEGLANEDVEEIVKILQRQRLVKDTLHEKIDIFTLEEQEQILRMERELTQCVFRVSDDMYCYKHYFLPVPHFESSVFVYKHGIDCIENLDAIKDKDILDVGGFIGDSILILKPLTDRRVISFEAVSANYHLMEQTVELNHLENVILEHLALGEKKETMTITLAGSSSAFNVNDVVTTTGIEEVKVDTLDAYLEGTDINVGLIKVDIEGAEQSFLKGAKKTIEKFKPVLLMSIYHNADDFFNIKPIIESWNLGYKFRVHKPVDYSVSREVLLIAEVRK